MSMRPNNIANIGGSDKLLSMIPHIYPSLEWAVSCWDKITGGSGISVTGVNSGRPKISANIKAGDGIKIEESGGQFDNSLTISLDGEPPTPSGGKITVKSGDITQSDVDTLDLSTTDQTGELPISIDLTGDGSQANVKLYITDDNMETIIDYLLDTNPHFVQRLTTKVLENITFKGGEGANIDIDNDSESREVTIDVRYK